MNRKSARDIKKYYSKDRVVSGYDKRRFEGLGGRYVDGNETSGFVEILGGTQKNKVSVLDLGAGRGRLSTRLAKLGYEIYCLDASAEMVKVLNKKFPRSRILFQSAFEPLHTSKKFDVIVSLRFLDHFDLNDQERILRNALTNLDKKGIVVFTTLNKWSVESLVSRLFSYGRYNYYYQMKEYERVFESLRMKTTRRVSRFFLPRGVFLAVQAIPLMVPVLAALDRLLLGLFPGFGALQLYSLSRRKK